MAMTAEINKLIQEIHNVDRSGDWQQNLASSHQSALSSLSSTDVTLKNSVLNEILRQRVDENILEDVMAALDMPNSDEFSKKLSKSASDWQGNLTARSEQDAKMRPRELSPQFAGINQEQAQAMQQALADGNIITMLSAMMIMLQQMGQGGQPSLGGVFAPVASSAPVEAPETEAAASQPLPIPDVDIAQEPEGQELHGYFMQAIFDENYNTGYRDATGESFVTPGLEDAKTSPTPEDMRAMFVAKIERDIKSGDFPFGDFPPEIAAVKAQEIADTLYDYALSYEHVEPDYIVRSKTYVFTFDENKIDTAINALFSGDSPVISNSSAPDITQIENITAPMNDLLHHSAPVEGVVADTNANGDILINAPNGTPLFALTNPEGGYAVYLAEGNEDIVGFTEIGEINERSDIERLFGNEFSIRLASTKNEDGNNNAVAGYYIESGENKFYIGSDALPEAQVTEAFKFARSQNIETQAGPIAPSMENSVGVTVDQRPAVEHLSR